MKITATKQASREIEIVVYMVDPLQVAASDRVVHRDVISEGERYTDFQLQWYNDLIDNVVNSIKSSGFNIIHEYQSSESYSYYIEFEAFTSEGRSLGNFTIKIRISDHYQKHSTSRNNSVQDQVAKGKRTIFRSIVVNGISVDGIASTTQLMWRICDELLAGNIRVLDELGR